MTVVKGEVIEETKPAEEAIVILQPETTKQIILAIVRLQKNITRDNLPIQYSLLEIDAVQSLLGQYLKLLINPDLRTRNPIHEKVADIIKAAKLNPSSPDDIQLIINEVKDLRTRWANLGVAPVRAPPARQPQPAPKPQPTAMPILSGISTLSEDGFTLDANEVDFLRAANAVEPIPTPAAVLVSVDRSAIH